MGVASMKRWCSISGLLAGMLLGQVGGAEAATTVSTIYSEDFNGAFVQRLDKEPSEAPTSPSWVFTAPDKEFVPKLYESGSIKYLKVDSYREGKNGKTTDAVAKLFFAPVSGEKLIFEYKFMLDGSEQQIPIAYLYGTEKEGVFSSKQYNADKPASCKETCGAQFVKLFIVNQRLRAIGVDNDQPMTMSNATASLSKNKWYQLRLEVDLTEKQYRVALNGSYLTFGSGSAAIEWVRFSHGNAVNTLTSMRVGTHIDDLVIQREVAVVAKATDPVESKDDSKGVKDSVAASGEVGISFFGVVENDSAQAAAAIPVTIEPSVGVSVAPEQVTVEGDEQIVIEGD